MKSININGVNYHVIDNMNNFENTINSLYKYNNIAFDNGEIVLPITFENVRYPAYLYQFYHLVPINLELIDEQYLSSNIVNFKNDDNLKDYLDKCKEQRMQMENALTRCDNIFKLNIDGSEDAEKYLIKEAINLKNIDIYKYQDRIGKTFPNDLRELKVGPKMSLKKIKSIANALDLEIEMIIRDKPNSVNPMNTVLSSIITSSGGGGFND